MAKQYKCLLPYWGVVEVFFYDEEDLITEVGSIAWEEGNVIDAEDVEEAIEYATKSLGWEIICLDS